MFEMLNFFLEKFKPLLISSRKIIVTTYIINFFSLVSSFILIDPLTILVRYLQQFELLVLIVDSLAILALLQILFFIISVLLVVVFHSLYKISKNTVKYNTPLGYTLDTTTISLDVLNEIILLCDTGIEKVHDLVNHMRSFPEEWSSEAFEFELIQLQNDLQHLKNRRKEAKSKILIIKKNVESWSLVKILTISLSRLALVTTILFSILIILGSTVYFGLFEYTLNYFAKYGLKYLLFSILLCSIIFLFTYRNLKKIEKLSVQLPSQ